jgi:hypothetical protein
MRIVNAGRGIHQREIPGIDRLRALPNEWIAFTNLDLSLPQGSREIDVILIADDRIMVIDLKDWRGKIESADGSWIQNGYDKGRSPVGKINENAKQVYYLLRAYLSDHIKRTGHSKPAGDVPRVQGLVLLTATSDISGIAPTERASVYCIDPFLRIIQQPGERVQHFRAVPSCFVDTPLTSNDWKPILSKFFNVSTGRFRPGSRRYGGYRAASDEPCFVHRSEIFSEFDVEEESAARAPGILRRWDFAKADVHFQTEAGRAEIAGRERTVVAWLNDRNADCESTILQPKTDDSEKGVAYWEIFDKRRRLKRLSDFARTETDRLSREERLELARQLLARVKTLHDLHAIHLDLGPHSIWLESPSTVRLSHLMAASFPEVRSLGELRYQFLSSSVLPESVIGGTESGQKKDVFLLGCAVHHILFGAAPKGYRPGDPSEWSSDIDQEASYANLHQWFERSLTWEPKNRFSDAAEMLEAFNRALTNQPSARAVIEGLERFRTIKSQLQLVKEYPPQREIRDDDRVAMWISQTDGHPVFVKMWKRSAWGDQAREAPRILDFLERAESLSQTPSTGCASIRRAVWLGDAIVLVHDFIDAPNVRENLAAKPEKWGVPAFALSFVLTLAKRINALHERGLAHGDLKPENILDAHPTDAEPTLIDVLDFSSETDGEIRTTAYAPASGGRFERDRFAVTKIAEEILVPLGLSGEASASFALAIETCRKGPPENATLLPIIEVLGELLHPKALVTPRRIVVSIEGASMGPVLPDEGFFGLRRAPDKPILFIRGASEEIEIHYDGNARPMRGRRRALDQKRIRSVSRHEFAKIYADVQVAGNQLNDFNDIEALLSDPEIAARWNPDHVQPSLPSSDEDDEEPSPSSEEAADFLGEVMATEDAAAAIVDLPHLWRRLIDVEGELKNEGVANGDSTFRRETNRHVVPFDLEIGTFDFDRDDTVLVERLDRGSRWVKIGHLELGLCGPEHIAINAWSWTARSAERLVLDGQRLRFTSHFEATSRSRREAATSRILARQSMAANLIDAFDQRSGMRASHVGPAIDVRSVMDRYELNDDQAQALVHIVSTRPLGLLQGPPGTGKTKFIAALVHYALTHGIARNVLLASQSHEAVNNAGEEVLALFSGQDHAPSIIRVGHENNVSERLLPYHSARVETLFKDRFRATTNERLGIAGRALGITENAIEALTLIEGTLRPVVERLQVLTKHPEEADAESRLNGLKVTLQQLLVRLGVDMPQCQDEDDLLDAIVDAVIDRDSATTRDQVAKFRAVARLGRDIVGSISTRERSFETFLAGTRRIVAGTCVGLGRASLGLTSTAFDLVIVDEAARCTASELAVPIQAGRWIVLVGDQAQLEPLHRNEVVEQVAAEMQIAKGEVVRSDFERVFTSPYGTQAASRLTKQYRMLPPIGQVASAAFYAGALTHGRNEPVIAPGCTPGGLDHPLLWVSTDSHGERAFQRNDTMGGNSLANVVEADLITSLLKEWDTHDAFRLWLIEQSRWTHPIGVICTYSAQSALIRSKLRYVNLSDAMRRSIKIDTVDSYQGKENPVVILSLVRNNAEGRLENGVATIKEGFLARPNRINVAITRAMDHLVIVGARTRWRFGSPISLVSSAFDVQVARGSAKILDAAQLQEEFDSHARPRASSRSSAAAPPGITP